MERLVIEGNKKQLEAIMRENRTRASRYALEMFFEEPEKPKSEKKEAEPVKQQAKSGSAKTTGKK